MLEDYGDISYCEVAGRRIALQIVAGDGPSLFFLPGFASDMTGLKAQYLAAGARRQGRGFTSLDYSGHGRSDGTLVEGDLAQWLEEVVSIFDHATQGPQIVIGSSMGGWLALHLALRRPERVQALIGIAAAPDFTEDLMWARFSEAQRRDLEIYGSVEIPSAYGPPQIINKGLIESGRTLLLLRGPIAIECPVRLIHGMQDRDVPYQTSLKLAEMLTGSDVQLHLVKSGEHRLSREEDLALLQGVVMRLSPLPRGEG